MKDLMILVVVDLLSGMDIVSMTTLSITLEFMETVAYVVDVLVDGPTVLIIEVVTAIGVDILAGENGNGLAAVMTPLVFTLISP